MKAKLFALALLSLLPAIHSLRADTLLPEISISFSGSIVVETNTNGMTVAKPINIKNILSALGVSSTDKDLRYYYDTTTSSYVIAAKGMVVGGTGAPLVTVFTYTDSSYVQWDPTKHSDIAAGVVSGLDDNLTGTGSDTGVFIGNIGTYVTKFILFGTVSGHQAIMKGTVVDVYKESL